MGPRNSRLRAIASRKLVTTAAMIGLFASPLCGAGQLDSVVPGRWHAFPNSRMDAVKPSPMPAGELQGIMVAWGGGIYDTDRERLVVWGGGHQDYAGNEVYAFGPLTSDTPRWERLSNPSIPWAVAVNFAPDGRPVSRHTYNFLAYLPAPHNKMMSCTVGARFGDGFGAGSGIVDFFNLSIDGTKTEPWSRGPNAPFNGAPGGFCMYNPLTQSVWYQPMGGSTPRLQEYRPATNSWISYSTEVLEDRNVTPAIDTRRNLMVSIGTPFSANTTHSILLYDLNQPTARPIRIATSGPKNAERGRYPGFTYDSKNDQFIGWNGGSAIYSLKAPANPKTDTWVWSQFQLDAGNTVIPTTVAGLRQKGGEIGTFGRFQYVASQNGVMVVNGTDESVYFFKLPSGSGGKLPSVNISADPVTISAGGSTTLSWSTTNATSCTAAGAWSGAKGTSGTEARGPLTGSNTFILTCDNGAGGVGSGSVIVSTAQAIPAPSVDLNANPPNVDVGGPTTLDWTSNSAASCVASGGWSGPKSISGSQNIGSVTQPTSFVLTCQGTGGTGSDAVTVNIGSSSPTAPGRPELNLSSERSSVTPGGSLRLTWNSTGANSCIASNAWSGAKAVSGTQTVSPTGPSSTYVLSCSGVGGSTERNVTVVVATSTAPAESPAPAPARRGGGGGSLDLLTLAFLGLLAAWRYRERLRQVLALTLAVLILSPSVEAADVTTLILQSQSSAAQSDVPFTFGQVFKVGEVPSQTGLKARLGDGSSVPLQVDAKATHPDGSLRHAVLNGRLNTLAGNGSQLLTLSTGPLTGGTPLALSELLASTYDTSVSLSLGGIVYTASAREALGRANVKTWLSGPMASEWIAVMPVRTAAGANHPHLTAYFHVRAFTGLKQVRTDVVIENNWAFVPSPNNFDYTATVSVPGKTNYVKSLTHYRGARWHKRFWWGTEPRVYAKLDKVYLQDTRAIPKYENLQPTEAFLNSVRRSTEPMNNGDHEPNMDASGYQPGIGLLPRWDAVYAISTDVRAFDYMLANADGGTAYGIHIRDEKTGLPISIDNHPITSIADTKSQPSLPVGGGSIYFEGSWSSHQPSIGFLPYVVTGDFFYLEEAHFWSSYNLIWPNTNSRNGRSGWWFNGSIRGIAWAYRSLAQAAYITPDAHPYKAYLVEKLKNNIARDTELYVSPGGPHKNNLGAMFSFDGNDTYLFHDYFMSSAVQYVVELGFTEIIPFRDYKLKFPVGIMGKGANEYCFQAAAQFKWKAGPAGTTTFFPDFRTMFTTTVPGANPADCGTVAMTTFLSRIEGGLSGPNAMLGLQGTATHYFANLLPALAAAFDAGVPGGRTAWERARASGKFPDFRDTPIYAVVPRALATSSVNVSIAANPPKVAVGGSSTLSWSASNAETCLASGGWAGSKSTAGSETVSGLQSTQSYVLTCTSNTAGTNAGTAVVTVGGVSRPTVTLSASTSVQSGQPLTLTWSSSDADNCVASGGWRGNKALSGAENVGPLSNSTSFSLGCTGPGGMQVATMNVSVVVAAAPTPGSKKGGGGAMTLSTLLMLLGAIAVRRIATHARAQ